MAFIIGGAVLQTAFSDYLAFFGNEVNSAAIFIIVIGIVCIVVSFFGCCGAYKENHCMVITVSKRRQSFMFSGVTMAKGAVGLGRSSLGRGAKGSEENNYRYFERPEPFSLSV